MFTGVSLQQKAQDDTNIAVVLGDLDSCDDRLSTGLEMPQPLKTGGQPTSSHPAPRSVPWLKQFGGSASILVDELLLEMQFWASNDDRNPKH